jgi:hypothetical protein
MQLKEIKESMVLLLEKKKRWGQNIIIKQNGVEL